MVYIYSWMSLVLGYSAVLMTKSEIETIALVNLTDC